MSRINAGQVVGLVTVALFGACAAASVSLSVAEQEKNQLFVAQASIYKEANKRDQAYNPAVVAVANDNAFIDRTRKLSDGQLFNIGISVGEYTYITASSNRACVDTIKNQASADDREIRGLCYTSHGDPRNVKQLKHPRMPLGQMMFVTCRPTTISFLGNKKRFFTCG